MLQPYCPEVNVVTRCLSKKYSVTSCDVLFKGVGQLEGVELERQASDAATRIQAVYRGHQVRRSMDRIHAPQPVPHTGSCFLYSADTCVAIDDCVYFNCYNGAL